MEDQDSSMDLVAATVGGGSTPSEASVAAGEALVLRAHLAAHLQRLSKGPAEEMELLSRIDAGLEQCALATGGTGRQIREAWTVGVQAFLREP